MKKYNDEEMAKLISEVETEFKDYLTKAEQTHEDIKKSEENVESVELKEESEETQENLEKTEEKDFDYDDQDIEEMNELYASMTKAEAEAHYKALKSTLFTEEESKMNKSEDLDAEEKTEKESKEETLLKAEVETVKTDLESSKKENEELKKSLETLTSIISKVVKTAPKRKAITQISDVQYVKKSEDTSGEESEVDYSNSSKSDINKLLVSKIRKGEINKSEDRENINQYCVGKLEFDDIKYLL